MYAMIGRSYEYVVKRPQAPHELRVDPELIYQVHRLDSQQDFQRKADEKQRHVEYP